MDFGFFVALLIKIAQPGIFLVKEITDGASHDKMLLGTSNGHKEKTQSFVISSTRMADLDEVTREDKFIIVPFGWAPGGIINSDHEDIFELEALAFMRRHDLDGMNPVLIRASIHDANAGELIVTNCFYEIGKFRGSSFCMRQNGITQGRKVFVELKDSMLRTDSFVVGKIW